MTKLMLDTNVFNDLLDGKIPAKHFEGYELCATHIQADEISRTGNEARRLALTTLFTSIVNEKIPSSTTVWDDSKWDESKWSDGKKYKDILHRLEELDRNSGKKLRFPNQSRDARIAETAIENGLTLTSQDQNLIEIMREFGGKFLSP